MSNNTELEEQKKLGSRMLWIFWIILLGALVMFFGNWQEKQYNPNQHVKSSSNEQSRTITLKRNRAGHYVASGAINDKPTVFLLDTGATDVAVPEDLAKQMGLIRGQAISVMTANGIARAYQTEIRSLKLGNITLHNVRAAITPGMQGLEVLLGMSALKQLDFNQSGDILTLTQYVK